ncbi:hypothetical protein LPJ78_003553 [Coemansia sp. RSA 989]|nr:membrane fusion protein Use1-domain-containing protein [Coemansia mojavensis]KAJ1741543.1 hypothetical protein LPJ68_002726 [Coemansia sp. RSA 1086]KAJ1864158.1 hypothetical protein LPJ78_003553 [Coemansia sp. RSA 989]KAJ2673912.1 hypothetical protein IWW42_002042 [Coemansia sp. RSA 1085]
MPGDVHILRGLERCEQQLAEGIFSEPLDARQLQQLANMEQVVKQTQGSMASPDLEKRVSEIRRKIAPWIERKHVVTDAIEKACNNDRPTDADSELTDEQHAKNSDASAAIAQPSSDKSPSSKRKELLGEAGGLRHRRAAPDSVEGVEQLLKAQRETHEDLTSELTRMAGVLKANSLAFGDLVERDKGLVHETSELLSRSVAGVGTQGARVGKFRKRSWGTTGLTWLAVLVVVSVFFMLVLFMKVAPKRF